MRGFRLGLLRVPMLTGVGERNRLEAAVPKGRLAEARLAATDYQMSNSVTRASSVSRASRWFSPNSS